MWKHVYSPGASPQCWSDWACDAAIVELDGEHLHNWLEPFHPFTFLYLYNLLFIFILNAKRAIRRTGLRPYYGTNCRRFERCSLHKLDSDIHLAEPQTEWIDRRRWCQQIVRFDVFLIFGKNLYTNWKFSELPRKSALTWFEMFTRLLSQNFFRWSHY